MKESVLHRLVEADYGVVEVGVARVEITPFVWKSRTVPCPCRGSNPRLAGRPLILGHRRGRRGGGGSVPTRGGAAVGAGGVAGLQHEVRARRRLGREDGGVVQDNEAAIEEFAQLDPTAGIGAVVGPRGDLDPARPEVNGIVAGYLARVTAAQQEGEIARGGPPGARRGRR